MLIQAVAHLLFRSSRACPELPDYGSYSYKCSEAIPLNEDPWRGGFNMRPPSHSDVKLWLGPICEGILYLQISLSSVRSIALKYIQALGILVCSIVVIDGSRANFQHPALERACVHMAMGSKQLKCHGAVLEATIWIASISYVGSC